MAKNKIQIDVMVNGKMEKATISAKKLKKALDGATDSQEELNASSRRGYRAAQGTAQNTANSTKAFAKQAGVVGGLVPIYATFAANVFAVSAAFGVLSRNAAIQQLETSLDSIGVAAGKNLPLVAENLRNITGQAISTEAALRATAVATTSGYSTSQLQNLTKVATGASIALGRSLPDALDRLVRGTAKLEPEILDELGIIVRLDQATREYAAELGKTAGELTQFERQQAFLNATIDQGLSKYQKIAQSVDPNPYDRLAAAFDNLTKTALGFINTAVTPIIEFLSANPLGLISALTLLGSTVASQILPALSDMADEAKKSFEVFSKEAEKAKKAAISEFDEIAKKIETTDLTPKGAKNIIETKGVENLVAEDFKAIDKSYNLSIKSREANVERLKEVEQSLRGQQKAASQAYIREKEAEIAVLQQEREALLSLGAADRTTRDLSERDINTSVSAGIASAEVEALARIQEAGAAGGFRGFREGLSAASQGSREAASNFQNATGAVGRLSAGFNIARTSVRLFGAAILQSLPFIGQVIFAAGLLAEALSALGIFEKSEIDKAVDKAANSFTNIAKVVTVFRKELVTMDGVVEKTYRSLEVMAGITDQTSGAISTLQTDIEKLQTAELDKALDKLIESRKLLDLASVGNPTGASAEVARQNVQAVNKSIEELLDNFGKVDKTQVEKVLIKKMATLQGSGAFKVFPSLKNEYLKLLEELRKGPDIVSLEEYVQKTDKLGENFRKTKSAVSAANEAFNAFDAAVAKLEAKDRTPFSEAIRQSETALLEIQEVVNQLSKGQLVLPAGPEDLVDRYSMTGGPSDPLVLLPEVSLKELEKQIPGVLDKAQQYIDVVGDPLIKVSVEDLSATEFNNLAKKYNTFLRETEDRLVKARGIEKQRAEELKKINNAASLGPGFVEAQIEAEDRLKQSKIETLKTQITLNRSLFKDQEKAAAANAGLQSQINALLEEQKNPLNDAYKIQVDQINAKKDMLSLSEKELSNIKEAESLLKRRAQLELDQAERARSRNRFGGGLLEQRESLKAQIQVVNQEIARRQAFIETEQDAQAQKLKLEYMLLDAKYDYLAAEANKLKQDALAESKKTGKPVDVSGFDAIIARAEKMRKGLGASALDFDKNGKIVGEATGVLEGALKNLRETGSIELDELTNKLINLKTELLDLSVAEVAFDAIADSLQSGLGTAITDIIDGTKSAKDAFGDLAISVLESFRKVLIDELTSQFFQMLKGQTGEGGFLSFLGPLFTRESAGTQPASTPVVASDYSSQGIDALINESAAPGFAQSVTPSIGGMGGGIDGLGLGASAANPLFVTMVADPMGAMGGVGQEGSSAIPGMSGGPAPGGTGGEGGQDANTAAIEKNTAETIKNNINTASLVTGGLATIAALTGNEKAAQALAAITAGLQVVQLGMLLWEKLFAPKKVIVEGLNTAATIANTAALAANTAAVTASAAVPLRTGGVMSNGSKLKGYSNGGISKGNQTGYPVLLHGTEAVVPLPNGRSIPVELSGGGSSVNTNNVSVNVMMNDSETTTSTDSDSTQSAELGRRIARAVQQELSNQKRAGGMLSPYGVS